MAARALSRRLRRTRSSASGSPRTVVSASALSVMVASGAPAWASSTSGRAIAARSTGVRVRARFEAGESEEVVDEAAESFAVAGDGCFEAVALGPFGLFAQERFDARLEGGDRVAEFVGGVREKAAGCRVAGACLLDRRLERVEHLVEGGGEAAELGVGAAGREPQLGVAVGDACRRLDDGGEGAQSGARALEDEERGERERCGRDEELDEEQVGDGVVDARAAGADSDVRSVRQHLGEHQQRSAGLDDRAYLGGRGRAGVMRRRCGTADRDPLEREAREQHF